MLPALMVPLVEWVSLASVMLVIVPLPSRLSVLSLASLTWQLLLPYTGASIQTILQRLS